MTSSNSRLIQEVENFAQSFEQINAGEEALMEIRDHFIQKVTRISPVRSELQKSNPLMEAAKAVERQLAGVISKWAEDWDAGKTTRELSQHFYDKVILLVFGKVNAGKSSLCNYVASLFTADKVKFFYLEEGELCYTQEPFLEGITETTARIQGVELDGKLVLLDSPGLHSVTDENGELTRRFTDSADAVLWLTPSTSPGQVQELDDLKIEMESGKPLLPVITRSDVREEDCDDEGNLFSILINKSPENRKEQEEDVYRRSMEKLGSQTEVRHPLSVSVHAYKESQDSKHDWQASGLAELDSRMAGLVNVASDYKPRKARQQIINYLDRSVRSSIQIELLPKIDELDKLISNETLSLTQRRQETLTKLQQELAERVTDWAEELKANKDRSQLASRINTLVTERLFAVMRHSVESFVGNVNTILVEIDVEDIGDFTDVEIQYSKETGRAMQAAASAGGAIAGAAAGSFLGPVGTIVGGIVGSLAGGAGGEYLVETEIVKEQVGVDATKAVEDTLKKLDQKLPSIIDRAFEPWTQTLMEMKTNSGRIRNEVKAFDNKLSKVKGEIDNEHKCH
ncbi:50S ribosome-binding GTPase [Vreelandella venusta]|uniref:GTPase n=1 Tax=Vreelandella venusta TaxID=44935 RepID=UPI0038500CCE